MTARPLNLTWGEHGRDGAQHTEWHAPCGCAYHPEPKPHVHQCVGHKKTIYEASVEIVKAERKVGCALLQKRLGVGYNVAYACIERMEREGIVGPAAKGDVQGTTREVL